MMMMTFITQGGEGRGNTNKKSKATKSKGRGPEEGASRALMRRGPALLRRELILGRLIHEETVRKSAVVSTGGGQC